MYRIFLEFNLWNLKCGTQNTLKYNVIIQFALSYRNNYHNFTYVLLTLSKAFVDKKNNYDKSMSRNDRNNNVTNTI